MRVLVWAMLDPACGAECPPLPPCTPAAAAEGAAPDGAAQGH